MSENPYFEDPKGESAPGESSRGIKVLLFYLGLILFPGLSGVLYLIIRAVEKGAPGDDIVVTLLTWINWGLALLGFSILTVMGFLLLVTGAEDSVRETNPDELMGDDSPEPLENQISASRLELRAVWAPALVYIVSYGIFRTLTVFWPALESLIPEGPREYALSLAIACGCFFAYFWSAGLARLNRRNMPIRNSYYFWFSIAALGLLLGIIFQPAPPPPMGSV